MDVTNTDLSIDRAVISVFGSHSPAPGSEDYETARHVGRLLAEAGYAVSTGGYSGMMSAVSQGAREAGGLVIGVTSAQVEATRATVLNRWVQIHIPFDTLQERLIYLVRNNDGIIVLPGGIGTLSELALAWSYVQVGEMPRRPLVLLGDMWAQTLDVFVREEYVSPVHDRLLFRATSADEAVSHIVATHRQKRLADDSRFPTVPHES